MARNAALFAIALALRLAVLAAWYTPGFESFDKGDFASYLTAAEWFAAHGDFRSPAFFVRPPAFPLLVWLLGGRTLAVLIVNALLGAAVAPIACALARRLGLSERVAFLAGMLTALDPGTIRYSTFLGPEALANAALATAMLALLDAMDATRGSVRLAVGAGILLVSSTLTRPGSFLLAPFLVVTSVVLESRRWRVLGAFTAVALAGSIAWMAHNGVVFGRTSISSVGPYTLLYYRAASLEHLSSGRPIDDVYLDLAAEVEARIGGDPAAVDSSTRERRHLYGDGETQAAMVALAKERIREHPVLYVATLPLGFARMYGLVTPEVDWPSALEALGIVWNAALLAAAAVGLRFAWDEDRRMLFWIVASVALYFTAMTLAVETSALDTRMRSMMTPFLAIAAVSALELGPRAREARSRPPA